MCGSPITTSVRSAKRKQEGSAATVAGEEGNGHSRREGNQEKNTKSIRSAGGNQSSAPEPQ